MTKQNWFISVLILILIIGAYLPLAKAGLVWMDKALVTANPVISESAGIKEIWSKSFHLVRSPMASTFYWIEYRLWGSHALGYHLVSLFLHITGVFLFWKILRELEFEISWLAPLIFAVHPVNVQSVAWIVQQGNLLGFLLLMISVWLYLVYEKNHKKSWQIGSLAIFILASMACPIAWVMPLLILLLDWWERREVSKQDLLYALPYFLIMTVFVIFHAWVRVPELRVFFSVEASEIISWIAKAGLALWIYMYQLIVPIHLMMVYPDLDVNSIRFYGYLGGLCFLVLIGVFFCFRNRWARPLWEASLFYLLFLFPFVLFTSSSVIPQTMIADYRQYIAMMGMAVLISEGFYILHHKYLSGKKFISQVLLGVLVLFFAYLTFQQTLGYRDEERLWQDTLNKNPRSWLAHQRLGDMMMRRGNIDEAVDRYRDANQLHADEPQILYSLGAALFKNRRVEDAIPFFKRIVELSPGFSNVQELLGDVFFEIESYMEAMSYYHQASMMDPRDAELFKKLGNAVAIQGLYGRAIIYFTKSLEIEPQDPDTYFGLGLANKELGNLESAEINLSAAILINPQDVTARKYYAEVLNSLGKYDRAYKEYELLHRNFPDDFSLAFDLGKVCSLREDYSLAATYFGRALRLDPKNEIAKNELNLVLKKIQSQKKTEKFN